MKQCSKCGEIKPFNFFHKSSRNKSGYLAHCKNCQKEKDKNPEYKKRKKEWAEENKEKMKEYYKKSVIKNKDKRKETLKKYTNSWRGFASGLIQSMKTRSKKKGFEWNDSWWSLDEVEKKIKGGRCEKTSIYFELERKEKHNEKRPFVPSVDRKDNNKGYAPENVQFVVWIYNAMKNSFDEKDVLRFINQLKQSDFPEAHGGHYNNYVDYEGDIEDNV